MLQRWEGEHYGMNQSCTYEDLWGSMGASESRGVVGCLVVCAGVAY